LRGTVKHTRADFAIRAWKLRFGKQDEPGNTAHLVSAGQSALLVEHTARGETRVREITFDGREPRRSSGIRKYLRDVGRLERLVVILLEGKLVTFDPETFCSVSKTAVDDLATELTCSEAGGRAYAGARGLAPFTQIVDLGTGTVMRSELPPPSLVLPVPSDEGGSNTEDEVWCSLPDQALRLVALGSGRVESVRSTPLIRRDRGTSLRSLGRRCGDRRKRHPMNTS
jgi:hypothetical protein